MKRRGVGFKKDQPSQRMDLIILSKVHPTVILERFVEPGGGVFRIKRSGSCPDSSAFCFSLQRLPSLCSHRP